MDLGMDKAMAQAIGMALMAKAKAKEMGKALAMAKARIIWQCPEHGFTVSYWDPPRNRWSQNCPYPTFKRCKPRGVRRRPAVTKVCPRRPQGQVRGAAPTPGVSAAPRAHHWGRLGSSCIKALPQPNSHV